MYFFNKKVHTHTHEEMPLKKATWQVQRMTCTENDRTTVTVLQSLCYHH